MREFIAEIASWISRKVEATGLRGGVVGLSGGLDSSVTAALTVRALGERALGLIMPCESNPLDEEHAFLVARSIGIRVERIDLGGAFANLVAALGASGHQTAPAGAKPDSAGLARANLKPRLRMAALYYYANKLSYLVVGTSNRSELLLGYFTKYGDGAADILPLGGLYKSEVRRLAQELGLPREVIEKPPSAGLWPGQTTEGELGLCYDDIDAALQAIESGVPGCAKPDVLDRVRAILTRAAHKRRPFDIFLPTGRTTPLITP